MGESSSRSTSGQSSSRSGRGPRRLEHAPSERRSTKAQRLPAEVRASDAMAAEAAGTAQRGGGVAAQAWVVAADDTAAADVVILEGITIRSYKRRPQHNVRRNAIMEVEMADAEVQTEVWAQAEPEAGTAAQATGVVVQAAPLRLASEQALRQAREEGLTLRAGNNSTGYFGVCHDPSRTLPYRAQLKCGGKKVCLGNFATAEEAALCVARSPEGRRAAQEGAAAATAAALTSEEAVRQALEEGLPLLQASSSNSATGYFGVYVDPRCKSKPYTARVWRAGGRSETLGQFATAEEAALCVARTPEGRAAAAKRAAAAPPLTSEEARQQAEAEGLTLRVADNKTGYYGVYLSKGARSATVGAEKQRAEFARVVCVFRWRPRRSTTQ